MTSLRTQAACHAASERELRVYPVLTPIIEVADDTILFGDDVQFRAAMVAKYGNDWEMQS